jgi:hypothetical protein
MDGMDEAAGVIVVGATNKPELVDPALMRPGRFDKVIFIPAPSYVGRREIFNIHLKNKPVSKQLNIEHLAKSTEGFSGADIENLVKEAAILAMKRSIRTKHGTTITNSDFLQIIPRIKPSLTREMKSEYDRLQADFERKKHGREIKLGPTDEPADAEAPPPTTLRPVTEKKARKGPAPARTKTGKEPSRDAKRAKPRKTEISKWRNVVGLDSSKRFFKSTIENNLKGGR